MLTITKGVKFTFINLVDAFIQSDLQLNIFNTHTDMIDFFPKSHWLL